MNLVAKRSGGFNLIMRPQARRPWYPADRARPVQAEVWWRYEGQPAAAAQLIGAFAPGQQVSYPFNPLVDRNVILSTITVSSRGIRSVRDIADAPELLLVFQRETAAPTLTQVGANTHTLITLTVDGFSTLAIKRKVRTADDSGMTTNLVEYETEVSPGEVLPRVIYLIRDDAGTGTRDVWARVSHSSGGAYGAESTAQMFTWADDTGAGGGDGDGDPFGGGGYCFSGNTRLRVAGGVLCFDDIRLLYGTTPFLIRGELTAQLVIHEDCNERMIDMGAGELVTPAHLMKDGADWRRALEHFPDAPRCRHTGALYNLHILSDSPLDHWYELANGETAHNNKPGP
ncbi:MAG: hypothetical protein ACRD9S_13160 [Pyrinomonadaceae bacterium]